MAHRLSCPAACGISLNRDRTWVSSIGCWVLNHWTTREIQYCSFLFNTFFLNLSFLLHFTTFNKGKRQAAPSTFCSEISAKRLSSLLENFSHNSRTQSDQTFCHYKPGVTFPPVSNNIFLISSEPSMQVVLMFMFLPATSTQQSSQPQVQSLSV